MKPTAALLAPIAALLLLAPPAIASEGWAWPVRGDVVTPYRNGDDPYAAGQHRGVDIAAPAGTPVVAATAGTIVYSGVVGASGLTISQRTADGQHVLSYLHLSSAAVRGGQPVAPGTPLGAVGTSGSRPIAQPHLHFGVRESSDRHAYLDPLRFLAPPPAEAPQPRPVPAPVPVGAPAPPLAVPGVPAPVAAPAPVVDPVPSGAPSPAPAPWGFPEPAAAAVPAHAPAAPRAGATAAFAASADAGGRARAEGASGGQATGAGTAPHHSRHETPRPAFAGPAAAGSRPHAGLAPVRAGHDTPGARRGLDVGWLVACVALVAAAMLLAGPRRGGPAPRPGRTVVAALLRAGR